MAHPHPTVPAPVFSPQSTPSPVAPQPGMALPPQKRPRLSPLPPSHPPSQPTSPYATYPSSPNTMTPVAGAVSPNYANIQAPINHPQYNAHYTNGNTTPTMNLPPARINAIQTPTAGSPPILTTPQTPTTPGYMAPAQHYSSASFTPVSAPPGTMGPPQKPAEKATKEYEYDVSDSLAGTGIDIRAEEGALQEYYANQYGLDARTGFPAGIPGGKEIFYGAGPASQQPAQLEKAVDQKVFEASIAERAWNESAARLSTMRAQEQNSQFCFFANLHWKAEKKAKEFGLELNKDMKNPPIQKSRNLTEFPSPQVTVKTSVGPDGAIVSTYGSLLPPESYLIDQLALLSIATKHRMRELIEDADKIATTRQQTSHGIVPEEWADIAVPLRSLEGDEPDGASPMTGVESAVSPRTNPLKRPLDAIQGQKTTANGKPMPISTNHLTQAMREVGRAERDLEESRLRKRMRRTQGADASAAPSRSGSVAPTTPGSVAPEPEKALTKKELKKSAAAKQDLANAANVNRTTMQFLGGFGKKKKGGRSYDWMTGGSGSGASTPSRAQAPGAPGVAGPTPTPLAPENTALTLEGRNRLGIWREDGEKGKGIQLRDLVVALERDGRDRVALQKAYNKLDESEPR